MSSTSTSLKPVRMAGLDYLRGLMAVAVMLFHYDKWASGFWHPDTLLGKLGVYAVSIFFVLSGLTLGMIYRKTLQLTAASLRAFALKRFFRIMPLLWLATTVTLLLDPELYTLPTILFNYSGLFGFLMPHGDIALGAWSIGCELVYYSLFPLLIWLLNSRYWLLFGVLLLSSMGVGCLYATFFLQSNTSLTQQWATYVQAPNHAFYFFSGVALSVVKPYMAFLSRPGWFFIALIGAGGLVFWPIAEDPIHLVTGANRFWLSCFSLLICGGIWGADVQLQGWMHRFFHWLGAISYTLYLLHPLTFRVIKTLNVQWFGWGMSAMIALSIFCTILVSHWVHRYFEQPLLRFGRTVM